jgi:membrane associated rhomboid family serine protease
MEFVPDQSELITQPWLSIAPRLVKPELPLQLGKEQARLWALVLDARSIPCCLLHPEPSVWELRVPPEQLERALSEITAYEEKNLGWPPPLPPPRPMVENSLATLSVLILLATFHNIITIDPLLPGGIRPDWLAAGSFRTDLVMDGQWWRLITPLTLHRDVAHLLGNLAIGGVFVLLLCRELGSGLAWSLILAAGTFGNLANALVQPAEHTSVGASTAVFGTVGILAALSAVRYRHHLQRRWGLPVAAALALLVVLGSEGKNTDLGAHLFGCGAGILLGLVTELVIARRGHPSPLFNALLALSAGLSVAVAWLYAINFGG